MRRRCLFLLAAIYTGVWGFLGSAPSRAATRMINLQGRLTDPEGVPVSAPTQVEIRLYQGGSDTEADDGLVVYKERAVITPGLEGTYQYLIGSGTPVEGHVLESEDFLTDLPVYLQINVEGRALLPRIRLTATSASFVSEVASRALTVAPDGILGESIQDGAVSPDKLNAGILDRLIPPGLIGLFAGSCPAGWSPFTEMDNLFLVGTSAYTGIPGGSAAITGLTTESAGSHSHTVNAHSHTTPNHDHDMDYVLRPNKVASDPLGAIVSYNTSGGLIYQEGAGVQTLRHMKNRTVVSGGAATGETAPSTDTQEAHAHVIQSDESWRPPHLGLVFCIKD